MDRKNEQLESIILVLIMVILVTIKLKLPEKNVEGNVEDTSIQTEHTIETKCEECMKRESTSTLETTITDNVFISSVETTLISNISSENETTVSESVVTTSVETGTEKVSAIIDEAISCTVTTVETTASVTQFSTVETEATTTTVEPVTTTEETKFETTVRPQVDSISAEDKDRIMAAIQNEYENYSGIKIGVGVYSYPDFNPLFEYNPTQELAAGCTVKAPFACFVLKECEERQINIWSESITYSFSKHYNSGSGTIKYEAVSKDYTIAELISLMLSISDNIAYNMLLEKFPLDDYQDFLDEFDGQNLYECRYGVASVMQRKNEWQKVLEYCNNGKYGEFLANSLSNTQYCYIAQGLSKEYPYMHKSGWADGKSYTCAADCAVVYNTLIIIITHDYTTGDGHVDSVKRIAGSIEPVIK